MAANSTIGGEAIGDSYYNTTASAVSSSTGVTVTGRIKTYATYQDMLDDKQPGKYAYVKDASGDPSVESGFAKYMYEDGIWKKLFEEEAMDLSVGHTHTNMEVLNNFNIRSRRPTFGSDFLVTETDLKDAIYKVEHPDGPTDAEIELSRITNKLKYTFVNSNSLVIFEDQTYIVRNGVKLSAQLPNGDDMPNDVAIRLIVDESSAAEGGSIVPFIDDTINGDSFFTISEAMDVMFVYDRANRDWVVIGTTYR